MQRSKVTEQEMSGGRDEEARDRGKKEASTANGIRVNIRMEGGTQKLEKDGTFPIVFKRILSTAAEDARAPIRIMHSERRDPAASKSPDRS